jgi:hypothetical protein
LPEGELVTLCWRRGAMRVSLRDADGVEFPDWAYRSFPEAKYELEQSLNVLAE